MYVVGLTGGIGSGKSTVANIFKQHNVDVIDADQIAHNLVLPGATILEKISLHFGNEILLEDGSLNRSLLRTRIFNNNNEKLWLENLLHPQIQIEAHNKINSALSVYCIYAAPLLIENNLIEMVNRVLVVDLPTEMQILRASKRDHSNKKEIEKIIRSQISRTQRLEYADDILDNSQPASTLNERITALHQKYCELAQKPT